MIEAKGLYKIYEGHEVMTNVNAVFEKGMINMVIGSSGSGKTVLMRCLVGLIKPEKGNVFYDGVNFTRMSFSEKKKIRLNMGMLFQGSALFNSLTVFDNVAFPLVIHSSFSKMEIQKRVQFCLERVNLNYDVAQLHPQELSGGMQKRVGIARAISNNPKYLFVDEPNSGLDPKTSRVIDKLIKEITIDFDTTTVVNSHDMNSVFDIADRVFFIHEGKKWWEGVSSDILSCNNNELLQMMKASGHLIEDENHTNG